MCRYKCCRQAVETLTGPKIIKLFSYSTQLSMKCVMLINLILLTIANSFLLNIAVHEKSFITSGPGDGQIN